MIGGVPDFEHLSQSDANVVARVLGVLLGDDYRRQFLPALLARTDLAHTADWAAPSVQPVFFSQPLRAWMRARTEDPGQVAALQAEITGFLALPPVFNLRRNVDGSLTKPRGWNRRFIAQMLERNPDLLAELDADLVEARLWLFEEMADTEVSLLLQAGDVLILAAVSWLTDLHRTSRKPALREYRVTLLMRQYLVGLYLSQSARCRVHQLAVTCSAAAPRRQDVSVEHLAELVPSAGRSFALHHVTWQDVYEVAEHTLPAGHGLLSYMASKRARHGNSTFPLVAR
jgi:hypothetical protein